MGSPSSSSRVKWGNQPGRQRNSTANNAFDNTFEKRPTVIADEGIFSVLAARGLLAQQAVNASENKWIIDPRTSSRLIFWDVTTFLALIFTAIVTPYEVSFLQSPDHADFLWVFNRLIDIVFISDMCLQFFLAYPASFSASDGAHWEKDPKKIARHYLTGWFTIDFVSVAVALVDIITLAEAGASAGTASNNTLTAGSEMIEKLKVLRVVRVLRLVKLVRLMRGMRMLKRWETRVSVDYGAVVMIQCFVGVILFAHISSCVWSLQISFAEDIEYTWLGELGYCIDTAATVLPAAQAARFTHLPAAGTMGVPPAASGWRCLPPGSIYAASLYWAVMTITSIGYGDITATHQNPSEQVVATLLMLAGSIVYSQVVATFCGVLSSMNPGTTDFRITIDSLNAYMSASGLPSEMRQRLRDYFHRTKHLWTSNAARDVIMKMSPSLQGEVLLHVNHRWLHRVPWLANEDPAFIANLVLALRPAVFAPDEMVEETALHVVHRGMAIYGGKILRAGGVWGEDMLIAAAHLRSRYCAKALTYLEVYFINRDEFLAVAGKFSESLSRIRRRILFLALQRFIVLVTKTRSRIRRMTEARPATKGLVGTSFKKGTTWETIWAKMEQGVRDDARNHVEAANQARLMKMILQSYFPEANLGVGHISDAHVGSPSLGETHQQHSRCSIAAGHLAELSLTGELSEASVQDVRLTALANHAAGQQAVVVAAGAVPAVPAVPASASASAVLPVEAAVPMQLDRSTAQGSQAKLLEEEDPDEKRRRERREKRAIRDAKLLAEGKQPPGWKKAQKEAAAAAAAAAAQGCAPATAPVAGAPAPAAAAAAGAGAGSVGGLLDAMREAKKGPPLKDRLEARLDTLEASVAAVSTQLANMSRSIAADVAAQVSAGQAASQQAMLEKVMQRQEQLMMLMPGGGMLAEQLGHVLPRLRLDAEPPLLAAHAAPQLAPAAAATNDDGEPPRQAEEAGGSRAPSVRSAAASNRSAQSVLSMSPYPPWDYAVTPRATQRSQTGSEEGGGHAGGGMGDDEYGAAAVPAGGLDACSA